MNTDYKIIINLQEEIEPARLLKKIVKGIHQYPIKITKGRVGQITENKYFILFIKLTKEEDPEEIGAIIHNQLLDYEPEVTAELYWLDV